MKKAEHLVTGVRREGEKCERKTEILHSFAKPLNKKSTRLVGGVLDLRWRAMVSRACFYGT